MSEYEAQNWQTRALRAEAVLHELRGKIDSTVLKDAMAKVDGK